jgi:hypothetical protein
MITEAIAIELTKNYLKCGQDEKPLRYFQMPYSDNVRVKLSDGRVLQFNRVEVEHARIMLKKGEKNES